MKSLWNDTQAEECKDDELALRIYTSRLLGRDASLVLHGGGNTSVKARVPDIFGQPQEILYVKASGWDLETIKAAGFSACRMDHLLKLAKLDRLSDLEMARELRACMTDPGAATPSVEAILHALLPHKFVDHTHADAFISLCNTPAGAERVRDAYGERVVVVPYVMPGFLLARKVAELFPRHATPGTIGMVLMNHGLFSFGATARESYDRMIELVTLAEDYLKRNKAWGASSAAARTQEQAKRIEIATLRRDVSREAGGPMILSVHDDADALGFARRDDVATISRQGPATPDHVIRTKRVPLLGRDVGAFAAAYEAYFKEHAPRSPQKLTMLDPAPRVILDPELGLCTVGRTAKDARVAEDIYRHTIQIITRAVALGGWRALPAADLFDMEYWDLEQAKLRKAGKPPIFAGEVALVTGAASGIGKACVESLAARGTAVVALDVNPAVSSIFRNDDVLGVACDVTDEPAVSRAIDQGVRAFGGIDIAVLNAGIFPPSCKLADMTWELWHRVMRVNLDSNVMLMRELHPLLKLAPRGGRVAVIGSKNVPAPGPGAAAYSASKAAVNQLARVAALEWGADNIRINTLHPNAVFDTGLWTEEVLRKRADSYGMTIEQYKKNNVLRTEVTSHDVAELAAELCGPLFAKTTGAQIPVDGGNERVI